MLKKFAFNYYFVTRSFRTRWNTIVSIVWDSKLYY